MRDPTRIYKYCHKLADDWAKLPDCRFAQFMVNFIDYLGKDPFYMEDEEFFNELDEFVKDK